MLNSKGPSTLPWGTPLEILWKDENYELLTLICCCLSFRNYVTQFTISQTIRFMIVVVENDEITSVYFKV